MFPPIVDELHTDLTRGPAPQAIQVDMGGLAMAFSLILAVLIDELERTGVVSRDVLQEKVKLMPEGFKRAAKANGVAADPLTIDVINQFVSMYTDPTTPSAWKPTVIHGGKDK